MTKINRTPMAAVVNAVFNLSIKDRNDTTSRIVDILRDLQHVTYEYGIFPEQDSRVLKSVLWGLRNEHVSLQYVGDMMKPLMDKPAEGSLEANDTGKPDEHAVERALAIKENQYLQAIVERHIESLRKQVRSDFEEAGHRTEDGGRMRFNFKSSLPYGATEMDTVEDWYIKQLAQTPVGSKRYYQLIQSRETIHLPHVSAQQANDEWLSLVGHDESEERFTKLANRDWDSIKDLLTECGNELYRHEDEMAKLNAQLADVQAKYHERTAQQTHAGPIKTAMAVERQTHRQNINRPLWLLARKFEATALLAHVGVPQDIINSSEWRAKEAELRAAEARAKAQEAQAQMMEVEANMMEMEANMLLMQSRQALAQMQLKMQEQMAQFNAMMNPPKPKTESKIEPKAKKAKKPKAGALVEGKLEKEFKPLKGANVITTRGKASSWTPRG